MATPGLEGRRCLILLLLCLLTLLLFLLTLLALSLDESPASLLRVLVWGVEVYGQDTGPGDHVVLDMRKEAQVFFEQTCTQTVGEFAGFVLT